MGHLTPFISGLLIICSASVGFAQEKQEKRAPLTMTLSATVVPAPAQVMARVSVEPDARSRSLMIEWWSDEGAGGSHMVNLDGEYAAARHDFAIKRMEAGTYVVRAVLRREDGSLIKKQSNLVVMGPGMTFRID